MAPFDPHHQWLGIPVTARPISKYRLLGLMDFELDRGVIGAAAERQTIYLRTLQAGEHEVLVAQLLNEVSQARVTLLNADQKAEYDEELRRQQTPEPVPEPTPPPIPVVQTPAPTPVVVRGTVTQEFPVSVVQPAISPRKRKPKQIWKMPAVIGVSVVGVIGVFVLVISLMFSGDADPVASNTPPVVSVPLTPRPEPVPAQTTANTLPASLQEGLVAYYPFNGNTNDESGNGHHITDRQVTIAKKGRAMISEGGSFEVTIPGLPSGNMPRTLALTLVPTDRGINPRMVCYWGTPKASSYFGVSYWKGDAHRWFALSEVKVACALSQETQLVLACDGVKVKFYKNGVLVNDEELTLKTAVGDRFYIGSKTKDHSEFEGAIDDVRIYNRALSEAEVQQLYQFESSGTTEVHTSPYYFNNVAPIDVAALRFHFESEKHPLLVNGKRSRHGFLLHPRGMADDGVIRSREGIVTYRKPPNYQFLAGAVAIRDDSFDHFTALIFSLKVDDAVVWKSGPIKTSQQVAGFCIELPRARELTFLVNSQNAGFNNAVWLDPVLLKSTGGKSLEQIANEQQARWIKKEE
jgi:hypothetical protein